MNAAPWKLRFTGQDNSDKVVIQIIAHDGVIVVDNEQYYPAALDPQNAAVIAVAPTMLEALKHVFAELSGTNLTEYRSLYDRAETAKEIIQTALGIHANLEAKVKAVTEG